MPAPHVHPYCSQCGYDLTGMPVLENETYICAECGEQVDVKDATRLPWFLENTRDACLLTAAGPGFIIGTISAFQSPTLLILITFTFVSVVWILIMAAAFALRVARWKGPKPSGGPLKLFVEVAGGALFYLIPVSFFWWISTMVMFKWMIGA